MKILHTLCLTLATLSPLSTYAGEGHNHAHDHKPAHGGIVIESQHVDYELVARNNKIQVYLRDHGKPVDVTGLFGKVSLLTGEERQEAALVANGPLLEANGNFKLEAGTKIVLFISQPGKPAANVRFVWQ